MDISRAEINEILGLCMVKLLLVYANMGQNRGRASILGLCELEASGKVGRK